MTLVAGMIGRIGSIVGAAILAVVLLLGYAVQMAVMAAEDEAIGGKPPGPGVVLSVLPADMRANCLEATNGCEVCVVLQPAGVAHCSLPGIACQPEAWTCRVPKKQE